MRRWKHRPQGSNWGDFGENDELGRMNLITPVVRQVALTYAKEGLVFPLSLPLDFPGGSDLLPMRHPPQLRAGSRANGEVNFNYAFSQENEHHCDVVSDDAVTIWTQYSTQWDSLAHWGQEFDADGDGFDEIVYYNGYRAETDICGPRIPADRTEARKLGLETLAETCVQGRGVMVDLQAIYGEEYVLVGYEGLMNALDRQGICVAEGDLLCIYTGWADLVLSMNRRPDVGRLRNSCAVLDGQDTKLLQWLTDSGVSAICSDNICVEALTYSNCSDRHYKHSKLPLHEHCLFKQGIFLGEMWHFGDLVAWLRKHRRNYFLLTAPPLRLPGAVGSPVMPVATV